MDGSPLNFLLWNKGFSQFKSYKRFSDISFQPQDTDVLYPVPDEEMACVVLVHIDADHPFWKQVACSDPTVTNEWICMNRITQNRTLKGETQNKPHLQQCKNSSLIVGHHCISFIPVDKTLHKREACLRNVVAPKELTHLLRIFANNRDNI